MAGKGESTCGKKPSNEPGPSSSESSGREPKVDSDVEHTDEKIAMDGQPGPSTSKPSAATGQRPSARPDSEHPVDRTQPSLEHQVSTLLNWSILEQQRTTNEILAEMAKVQRLQTLMQIRAMAGAQDATDATYFMDLLQGIPRALAPDSVVGPRATASWDRLSSPNQCLMQFASNISFAHPSCPAVRLDNATEAFPAEELELAGVIDADAQALLTASADEDYNNDATNNDIRQPKHE